MTGGQQGNEEGSLSVMVHTCYPSSQRLMQEDSELEDMTNKKNK